MQTQNPFSNDAQVHTFEPAARPELPLPQLLRELKQAIKADFTALREQKRASRDLHKAGQIGEGARCQSALVRARRLARARLILYGRLRGRSWDRIERNHPRGDLALLYWLELVRRDLDQRVPTQGALERHFIELFRDVGRD